MTRTIHQLPAAADRVAEIAAKVEGKRVAVFLDYDGTLTPIVDRPEDAILSETARGVVRALSTRCTVGIVSGRDRADVEKLVGIETLVYAGSHGFDIASPDGRSIQRDEGAAFAGLLAEVIAHLHAELDGIDGALIEPKKASVAAHYRLVSEAERPRVKAVVDGILADHSELRMTPGKMVFEIQPRIDWNKGKAVLHVLSALGLDGDGVVPFYFGDDITDEDAFKALSGRGIGILVADVANPEDDRPTAADYRVGDPEEVTRVLDAMAR